MSDPANPPIPGLACGCGAPIYAVAVADPYSTGVGDMLAAIHKRGDRPVVVSEWVCERGHQLGVTLDAGELDLGIIGPEMVCEDGHPLNDAGRDPRDPMNPWPKTRPKT